MAGLWIDLESRKDLEFAKSLIEERLALLADAPALGAADKVGAELRAPNDGQATEIARRLWDRLSKNDTKQLVRAFASFDGPFSLEDVADAMGRDYAKVKAQKFRFGRTEERLRRDFGVELLAKDWNGRQNVYRMHEGVRDALRSMSGS